MSGFSEGSCGCSGGGGCGCGGGCGGCVGADSK